MKKRLVALVMALGLCLTLFPVSALAAPKSGFSDVPDSSPFSDAVAWAVSKGITN